MREDISLPGPWQWAGNGPFLKDRLSVLTKARSAQQRGCGGTTRTRLGCGGLGILEKGPVSPFLDLGGLCSQRNSR